MIMPSQISVPSTRASFINASLDDDVISNQTLNDAPSGAFLKSETSLDEGGTATALPPTFPPAFSPTFLPAFPPAYGPSSQDLAQRRKQLRAKRRSKLLKAVWRSLAITGFAAGTVWLATSPIWLIKSGNQIEISNNRQLSESNIKALLPVPYPQSLLKIKPNDLAERLAAYAPIKSAVVSRQLVPPRLTVKVTERVPVAVAIPDTTQPIEALANHPMPFVEPGLIDAQGYWMPRNSFQDLGASESLPELSVKGMRPGDQAAWRSLYQIISRSPVSVTAIDWTMPSNLILQTDLGPVHFGPYSKNFARQMAALDQMRSLPEKVNSAKVSYIDLQDPDNPMIEFSQK
ncbi:MAG: cell division protein FtsQ [Phormidesmis priestleyi]|uniref:Cell division protein FtsQ n=1 Tax=Phormidesmis priestleyi TaxID=268141 RepID=A0A2W4XQ27_9CYAN|nr:MAG: cell division protein FtsQ [Phormidesmis priestleyi]